MLSCSEYILKMELTGFPVGYQRGIKGDSKEIKLQHEQLQVKVNIRLAPQTGKRTKYSLQLDRTLEGNEAEDAGFPPKRDRVEVCMNTWRKRDTEKGEQRTL